MSLSFHREHTMAQVEQNLRKNPIDYACRRTALGWMIMATTEKGVCCVQFGDDEASLVSLLNNEFPNAQLRPSSAQTFPALANWIDALERHVSANEPRPDLPLDLHGTDFQMQVWQSLLTIQTGDTRSYGELAAQIDRPNAVRAVGTACGKNRIAVLIPCHRVLRSDGNLGGYRWGLERKQALLDKESDG
ncbi:methylated-DNA--[protein]-cysteine S-methyltransferase [Marinomonas sp. A79]|uniref:Methylated-DNA--[protein]-cysteine S-methyltransferase n=1 Tax=Marinomonas vulgaris TaxID=2823372 RepID=A0ABS5HDU8_9GAMM|nr:methylated-DNA--[protein]-cysteine S-methyltransferase [Marinomonas vulgaris]MBR7889609.1 methylated-DNA--[protein]-cysteine S-methyltransferase [Marinomonas vulgaris]